MAKPKPKKPRKPKRPKPDPPQSKLTAHMIKAVRLLMDDVGSTLAELDRATCSLERQIERDRCRERQQRFRERKRCEC